MNKEELIKENAVLRENNDGLGKQEEELRRDFARVFNWKQIKHSPYEGGTVNLSNPTWAEIFSEVGRLQAARTFYDLEGNVSELGSAVEKLEQAVCKDCELKEGNCGKHHRNY